MIFEDLLASYRIAIPSVMFRRAVIERLSSWFDTRFSMIEEFDLLFVLRKLVQCDMIITVCATGEHTKLV